MSTDLSGSPPFSTDGASASLRQTAGGGSNTFHSVLFERAGADDSLRLEEPYHLADLNLDQVLDSMAAGRAQYDLQPFFYTPLRDVSAVQYRHEVMHDLEKPPVLDSVKRFAKAMSEVREHLQLVEKLRYQLQKESWFVEAVVIYCEAVRTLAQATSRQDLESRALRRLRVYLAEYVESTPFQSLHAEAQALKVAFSEIRYSVRIQGPQVTVTRYAGDSDYSAQVLEIFARFRQWAARSYLARLSDSVEMNHVEAQILDGVAQLHPRPFERRGEYFEQRRDFLDATIVRFDREVQFYVAYLELIERLKVEGLSFCYPRVSATFKEVAASETFDLALAIKLAGEQRKVVVNDFCLTGPERVSVVSGPNNGGKTTFARTFGQLHHLASLGLPVPGREATLFLADAIYTHFEREEQIETLRGKLDDELVRVHEILEQATPDSLIVMNESFNSTTLNDALFVGTEVMQRILELGCLGVYVTFVEEIASLGEATVSMVSEVVPENPAERTFKLLRQPADGLAYAWALAQKYGLTYERLMERIQ